MVKKLELNLFGNLEIRQGGIQVHNLKSIKAQALLSYLALTGKAQTRPALAGMLWGEMPEANARMNLSQALSTLRRIIGENLSITRQTVDLNRGSDIWIDVETFESTVAEENVEALRQAVQLYRGDLLDGFYVRQSPEFETWILVERARLREKSLVALRKLVKYHSEQGEVGWDAAIDYTRQLLRIEPWHEEAHRDLMRLLACSGQRSAALKQYEICSSSLADNLAVEPMPATVALYDQIRQGKFKESHYLDQDILEGSDIGLDVTSLPAPQYHNLPAQTTPFIGRETELVELKRLLIDPEIRLVTIYGAGGMGKTRLAVKAGLEQLENFKHGVYFVPLNPLDDSTQIVNAIAVTINHSFSEGDNSQQQLLDFLRPKSMLLVLDSFEHLVTQGELVPILLQEAPGLKILVTSRIRLNVAGEQLFPIAGIDFPQPEDSLEQASQSDAIRLFVQSARRMKPGYELGGEDLPHVVQICRLVEGMPLSIILAAAWTEILSPAEIKSEIERSLDFLEIHIWDAPGRHWSIRSVFNQSWELLTEQEQHVFQNLSVFRDGFKTQAGLAVSDASIQVLRALVNKSLLGCTLTGRFQIHELLRQYAEGKLRLDPDAYKAARNAHSDYYCAFLNKWENELKTSGRLKGLLEIDKERENVRSAWNWAVANVQVEQLEQALESLASFYQWRGHFREAEILLGKAVEMVSGLEREDTQCLRIRIMIWQSAFNRDLGQSDLAMQHANLALDLLDAPSLSNRDMRSFRAAALFCLGSVILRYDYEEALRIWHESYELYKSIEDKWGMAKVLGYLSMIAWELGQLDKAKQIAEENLSLEKALGNQIGTGNMFSTLGWINLTQGQLYQAEELSQKCVQIYRQTGDQAFIAKGLRDASAPKIYLGRFDEAEILLEQSTSIYDELGGSGDLVFTNILLGATRVHLGQYDHARSLEQMSLKFAEKFNDRAGEGRALLWLGRVSLVEGLNTEAHQFLSKAAAIFQEIGKQDQLSSTLVSLAHSSLNLGNIPEARLNLKKALKISIDISVFLPLLFAFPVAALYAVKRGDKNRGIEIYSKVMRYAFVANSKWFADVFGAHIFDLNRPVQEEFVTAAQEQDMVLNLWSTARELLANPD